MATTRAMRGETIDLTSTRGLRSPSSSSDIMSTSGRSLVGGLPVGNPRPLYVAQSAAESLTSAELERPVLVTEAALDLVNSFLDQVLYNLLSLSKSTSMGAVRIAAPKLLKPRLGQAALSAGDEEVRDILEATAVEENQLASAKSRPSDFDLELVWKLARLRCMVYSRLGDMEEEDEEELLEQERLTEDARNPQASTAPVEALFLAAILGFLGEQALCTAAQHAEKRHNYQAASRSGDETGAEDGDETDLVLEPLDMLQLGREGPLSRLWRTWRRDTRSIESLASRPSSQGHTLSTHPGESAHARKESMASRAGAIPEEDSSSSVSPAHIPLPMRDNDVDEIEVPGLAPAIDGDEDQLEQHREIPERSKRRPTSMLIMPGKASPPDPTNTSPPPFAERSPLRPSFSRSRSQSLPPPAQTPLTSPHRNQNRDTVIFLPHETTRIGGTSHDGDERVQDSGHIEEDKGEYEIGHDTQNSAAANSHGNSRASIISGTVAAIAGALGVEAMRASRMNKEQQDQTFKVAERVEQPKKSRTVAEEILGPSNNVPPPADAQTGASITGPSDFDSMHIPVNANGDVLSDDRLRDEEVSDPEDLALSSADEENGEHREQAGLRDSGFAVARPVRQESDHNQELSSPRSPPSSPSSPKRTNREAAVIDNAMIPMRTDEEPVTGSEPVYTNDTISGQGAAEGYEGRTSPELPLQQHVPETTDVPHHGSSLEQPMPGHGPNKSKSSQYSHQSKSSSSSGRVFVHGRDQPSRPQNLSQQRAAFGESPQGGHSRNVSATKEQKGNLRSKRGRLRVNAGDDSKIDEQKKKSLEILIKSDETLHYTLTPESARATEFSRSEIKPKTETQDLAEFLRNTAPPGEEPTRPEASKSAKQGINGLRSNPPDVSPVAIASAKKLQPSPSPQPAASPSQPRNAMYAPRDARPERNTTRDLADYVRSTGPTSETQLPQALGTRPGTAPNGRPHAGGIRADGVPVAPVGNPSLESARTTQSVDRPVNRLKFQARDARPSRNTETSELIDLIREGPPRAAGEHRIDRKVAPFRTTMDSDDLNALTAPPEGNGRGSVGSVPESAVTSKSVQESTNSRTALLDSTNRTNGKVPNGASSGGVGGARQGIHEQNGMPPKTRRKPRDPYAIEDSEDELEEDLIRPQPRAQEESLIDFLRNTAPPPGMAPQPILAAVPRAQEQAGVKRTASNSRLKDVLTRESSTAKKSSVTPQGANSAREESPHLTQVGSKLDKYRPTQTTHAAHVDRNRQRPRAEARDPTNTASTTADLADYLKNSGPSEPPPQQPVAATGKDQGGFLKFFSRRGSVKR